MQCARALAVGAAAAMGLAVACGTADGVPSAAVPQASGTAAGVLLTQPPGFQMALDAGLDLKSASVATPAGQAVTSTALRGAGFSSGQERVWSKGAEHVTDLALVLDTDVDAAAFVQFEGKQIAGSPAATVSTDPQIPASVVFTLYGVTRLGSHQTFCQGVWFPVGAKAFELTDCAAAPPYPNFVQGLAQQQYARASS